MESIISFLAILVVGLVLYLVGNFCLGQNNSGGKRLIIFTVGILALCLAALLTFVPIQEGKWSEWFTVFIFGAGIISAIIGITLILVSVCAGKEKVDGIFDMICDGMQH